MAKSDKAKLRDAQKANKELEAKIAELEAMAGQNNNGNALTATNGSPTMPTLLRATNNNITGEAPSVAAASSFDPNPPPYCDNPAGDLALLEQEYSLRDRAKGKTATANETVKDAIKHAIRDDGWRRNKFITSQKGQDVYCGMLLDSLKMQGLYGNDPCVTANRAKWIKTYGTIVTSELNSHRNYVQGRIRKAFLDTWMSKHSQGQCQEGLWLKCLNRDIDLNVEEDYEAFKFYWGTLLTRATGNVAHWGEEQRDYTIISQSAPAGAPNKKNIPPSTEAILVLMIENAGKRWEKMYQIQQSHPGLTMTVLSKRPEVAPENQDYLKVDGKKILLYGPSYETRWTDSNLGQIPFSGWQSGGTTRFKELVALSKTVRAQPESIALEHAFLAKYKAEMGITAESKEGHKKMKKRKTAAPELDYDAQEVFEIED